MDGITYIIFLSTWDFYFPCSLLAIISGDICIDVLTLLGDLWHIFPVILLFFFFLGSSLQPAVSLSPSFLFFPIISPRLPSPQCRNTFYMEDPVSLPASVTRESSVQSASQWVPSLALDMSVFQIPWVSVVPYLWGTRDQFHGGQLIHRQGWESSDLRMIQEHQFNVHFTPIIIITSLPPQIIRD